MLYSLDSSQMSSLGVSSLPYPRKKRWDELNIILENNKKAKRDSNGQFITINHSDITWGEVKPIFKTETYTQEMKELPNDILSLITDYIGMVAKCFSFLSGDEAKRLYFITPIVVAVCRAFNGDVTIVVEEDIDGKRAKANGKLEMMLVKGNKKVCIVQAKKEAMEKGLAECLLSCEVVADLVNTNIVYGIITNYENWRLSKSTDTKIWAEELSLSVNNKILTKQSLEEITRKIYCMLSDEN